MTLIKITVVNPNGVAGVAKVWEDGGPAGAKRGDIVKYIEAGRPYVKRQRDQELQADLQEVNGQTHEHIAINLR